LGIPEHAYVLRIQVQEFFVFHRTTLNGYTSGNNHEQLTPNGPSTPSSSSAPANASNSSSSAGTGVESQPSAVELPPSENECDHLLGQRSGESGSAANSNTRTASVTSDRTNMKEVGSSVSCCLSR